MAEVVGYGDETSMRLLTNHRMEHVWHTLATKKVVEDCDFLEDWQRDLTPGCSANERAAGALYLACASEMREKFYATRPSVSKTVEKWRDIAITCRSIHTVDFAPSRDPELEASLDRTARHFEKLAEWLDEREGPRWLGYSKHIGLDEITRARVTAFISEADRIYVDKLRTPLATMATLALDVAITPKNIDNWRGLPSRRTSSRPSKLAGA